MQYMHNTEGVKPYYWKKWVKVDNFALNGAKQCSPVPNQVNLQKNDPKLVLIDLYSQSAILLGTA